MSVIIDMKRTIFRPDGNGKHSLRLTNLFYFDNKVEYIFANDYKTIYQHDLMFTRVLH